MSRIRTMEEMESISSSDFVNLVPSEFFDNPDKFFAENGNVIYQRFYNAVCCSVTCLIPLSDGSKWNFRDHVYRYEPLDPIAANN